MDSEKGGWYEGNKRVGQRGRDWREIYFAFVRFINGNRPNLLEMGFVINPAPLAHRVVCLALPCGIRPPAFISE